ncbi:hypothetical protein MMSR116_31595 [Methylobacterium mesophilicum SR1.6/6]|uniref:Uncharacterized protein n=1 Tax=Methylobacterium mesophilicum SR1.6/6 TaxID=908290 RepID=A0A6B9FTA7_9HYPH|nr:hypothetical protein [Methylobacterium mesophilicum]QGY05933.1 hypothetical protein MMSR116_31595 [Methylobacterium mesophilicum SR1.6/6]
MSIRSICCAALVSALAGPALAQDAPAAPDTSAATWQMPWQIAPIGAASMSAGEQTILSMVPGTGLVKGTAVALQSIGQPLPQVPGRNRTVDTCRAVVMSEAGKAGMKQVEAVSMGADKTDKKGDYFAPVLFRITYDRPMMYEVRQATMICIVNRKGAIVDAYMPADESVVTQWTALGRR